MIKPCDQRTQRQIDALTQEQPGPNHAHVQVRAEILHVAARAAARRRLFHVKPGALPRLYEPFPSERRHPGALLPEVIPGESPNLLVQGVHYMSSGQEQRQANPARPGEGWPAGPSALR